MLSPTFISRLRSLLPPHSLLHEREDLTPFESDGLSAYRNTPDVVVLPETEAQVAAILRLCHAHKIAVVARGAGTGLAAGALPIDGAVLLVLAKLNQIKHIDPLAGRWLIFRSEPDRRPRLSTECQQARMDDVRLRIERQDRFVFVRWCPALR